MNNGCGAASTGITTYPSSCTSGYAYYPNPADDELTVSDEPTPGEVSNAEPTDTSAAGNTGEFEAKLLNDSGAVLVSGKNKKGKKVVLKTKDIPNGTYYLHIVDEKEIIQQQIVIKH